MTIFQKTNTIFKKRKVLKNQLRESLFDLTGLKRWFHCNFWQERETLGTSKRFPSKLEVLLIRAETPDNP
jgi:hypothetical protein